MSDWTGGYVQNIDYTYGYYRGMNPARIKLAFLLSGLTPPKINTCCELGFGNGITINIHNAASPNQWYGSDFNPGMSLFANMIAQKSGNAIHISDDSFEEYDQSTDLPEFDFIALHGVWTYISLQNRAHIVSFIKKRLKPGGVVYVSYNLLAGWAKFLPLRNLMLSQQHDFKTQMANVTNPVSGSLEMLDQLVKVNAKFFQHDPKLVSLLESLRNENPDYIIHEFFSSNWNLVNFSDCYREFEAAKLSFACSANYKDHLSSIEMTNDQQKIVTDASTISLREDLRDIILERRFRMDYWVKGSLPLAPHEQLKQLSEQRLILWSHPDNVRSNISELSGIANIDQAIYHAVIDAMADYTIHSIGSIAESLNAKGVSIIHVIHITMAMIQWGHAMVVQDDDEIEKSVAGSARFNDYVLERSQFGTEYAHQRGREISYLASPVSGGGVSVTRIEQLFLLATKRGMAKGKGDNALKSDELADFAWGIVSGLGEKVMKDDTPIENAQDSLRHLQGLAKIFQEKLLPAMNGLRII